MIGLDTNILIRLLVKDDLKQTAKAETFIRRECSHKDKARISTIVLCETAWVLEGNYGLKRPEIADVFTRLLQNPFFSISEHDAVTKAVTDFKSSNADFSDHLISRLNKADNCKYTLTFDKKAAKSAGFERLK